MQPLLWLDQLWSWASTSVGRLPLAIALPVFEGMSLVFTTQYTHVKFNKFRGIYACLALNYEL